MAAKKKPVKKKPTNVVMTGGKGRTKKKKSQYA
jgi:hypothetical protein